MACVAGVVRVMRHSICGLMMCSVSGLNGSGYRIAWVGIQAVPVDGPTIEPRRRAGLQPAQGQFQPRQCPGQSDRGRLPDPSRCGCCSPIWITPRRKVPVVSTAAPQWMTDPSAHKTPTNGHRARSPGPRPNRPAGSAQAFRPAVRCIACRYSSRSAWARGPRTAGPLLRFSSLKWMPAASAARPISPSSASTSRTRCPLPIPPIEGLHDISPIVRSDGSAAASGRRGVRPRPRLRSRHAHRQPPPRRNVQSSRYCTL